MQIIKENYPNFNNNMSLSISELNEYRKKYLSQLMNRQIGELSKLEETVLTAMTDRSTLADKPGEEDNTSLYPGSTIGDKVASFGGSWSFIVTFLLLWRCG